MTKVRIFVTYKPSVFDPQGDTIKKTIHNLGHDEVQDVQVGKFFDVNIKVSEKMQGDAAGRQGGMGLGM